LVLENNKYLAGKNTATLLIGLGFKTVIRGGSKNFSREEGGPRAEPPTPGVNGLRRPEGSTRS